jgi:hypothetical protein
MKATRYHLHHGGNGCAGPIAYRRVFSVLARHGGEPTTAYDKSTANPTEFSAGKGP